MKATGIVRRIDDLGRIVVPKEIRRTLRIREGDALEIFTDREGEIILKKYSPLGEMGNFADQYAESRGAEPVCGRVCGKSGTDAWISGVYHRYRSGDRSSRTGEERISGTADHKTACGSDRKKGAVSGILYGSEVHGHRVGTECRTEMAGDKSDHLRRRCDRFCRDPGKGRQEKTR